jgi:cytochrome c oxidase subunit 1
MPRIRSERPAFELHYPDMVERLQLEAHAGKGHTPYAENVVGDATTGARQGPNDPDAT